MKYDYLVEKILYLERAENIKNFGDVVPHPIGDKVGALLTRLSDIESAEPSEAFYVFVGIAGLGEYMTEEQFYIIRTALLKAQSAENELAELKKKVKEYFKIKNMEDTVKEYYERLEKTETEEDANIALQMLVESMESYVDAEEKLENELQQLCEVKE